MATRIGKKIVTLRITANMTQIKLSKLLDVVQSRVSDWEKGPRNPPIDIIKKLIKIGKKYNIEFTLEDLLSKTGERTYIKNK